MKILLCYDSIPNQIKNRGNFGGHSKSKSRNKIRRSFRIESEQHLEVIPKQIEKSEQNLEDVPNRNAGTIFGGRFGWI